MNKTLQESFNRFLFLFGEAERIRRANITSSTKQLYWFSANQRRYAWRGNQRVETWCCRTIKSKRRLLDRRLKLYQPARERRLLDRRLKLYQPARDQGIFYIFEICEVK